MPIRFKPHHYRPAASSEDGFTLIEILVVCSLLAVVLAAVLAPIAFSEKKQSQDANYAYAQQAGAHPGRIDGQPSSGRGRS